MASKSEAGYVSDAQRAPRYDCDDQCSNCVHFVERDRNSTCTEVEGIINSIGWCKWYTEMNLEDRP